MIIFKIKKSCRTICFLGLLWEICVPARKNRYFFDVLVEIKSFLLTLYTSWCNTGCTQLQLGVFPLQYYDINVTNTIFSYNFLIELM